MQELSDSATQHARSYLVALRCLLNYRTGDQWRAEGRVRAKQRTLRQFSNSHCEGKYRKGSRQIKIGLLISLLPTIQRTIFALQSGKTQEEQTA